MGNLYFTQKHLGDIILRRLLLRNWMDKFDRNLTFDRPDIFRFQFPDCFLSPHFKESDFFNSFRLCKQNYETKLFKIWFYV